MTLTIELSKEDVEEALMEKAREISGALPYSLFKGQMPKMDREFLTLPTRVRFSLDSKLNDVVEEEGE